MQLHCVSRWTIYIYILIKWYSKHEQNSCFYKVVAKYGSIGCSFIIRSNDVALLSRMLCHLSVIILNIMGFSHYVTRATTDTPTTALIKNRNKKG